MEQLYLIAIVFTENVPDFPDIGLVFSVGAILVLHLDHQYRPAFLDGHPLKLACHRLLELVHTLKKVVIIVAQSYSGLLQQPPRQTTHVPFGADIRSRP